MKRIPSFLSILILLALGACTLRMPGVEAPSAIVSTPETLTGEVVAPTEVIAPAQLAAPTDTAALPTVAMPAAALPTPYPAPETQAPPPPTSEPTATQPAPTATPTPVITIDPNTAYGEPDYVNRMQFPNLSEWAPPETGELPNNRNIRLQFKDGELYVTGKRINFSTWWFSYHNLRDAYIEMTFETEDCSGEDAYGLIFRGPPHLAGESYGYAVSFTCSGNLWVLRLDGVNPWEAETLIDMEDIYAIRTGKDEENVIGVRAEGERFVIYANGNQIAEVEDDHFEKGRVGVFVRAGRPGAYTYRVTNFAYWILGEEE